MSGRPFLQIPGPTLVPERIVRAMSQSIIDHRGPRFAALVGEILTGLKAVFQAERGQAIVYPGSGTGGWEAAVVNTLSPGDRVLGVVNGHFSNHFCRTAAAHGIEVDRLEVPYGGGAPRPGGRAARRIDHQLRRPRRQRDLDGCDQRRRGSAPRPRRGAPSGTPAGRRRLVARVDRLPLRRVGRGRGPHRPPEGPHAAPGADDPGGERAGRAREPGRQVPAGLLGLGPGARAEQARRVPLHAGHRSTLRPPESIAMLREEKARPGLPAPRGWPEACCRAVRALGLGSSAGSRASTRTRSPPW
jgi:hypothetical protein